jgi:uncharacterized protein
MHPDHLPTPTALQRTSGAVVRVLLFPLLRLLWTAVLLLLAVWALARFLPSVGRLPNEGLPGALRNACLATFTLWATLRLFEGKTLAKAVGLTLDAAPARLAQGFLVGAGLLSAVTAILWLAGAYTVLGLGGGASVRALGQAALLFFLVAVFEEVVARGVVFRLLEQGLGTWAALALSALLFGFSHFGNPGATTLSSVAIALEAGLLLAAAYVATRTLWLPIGLHMAWNLVEGPVYGAPVSGIEFPPVLLARFPGPAWLTGGPFGPEAGVPAMVLGSLLGLGFLVLAVRRGQIFTPRWLARLLGRSNPLPLRTRESLPSGEVAERPV